MLSFHVKFVQTDGWTDGQTDNCNTICPNLLIQGHKKGTAAQMNGFIFYRLKIL